MKGNSEIKITLETVIAAVQMYMDSQFAAGKAPRVTDVSKEQYAKEFTVKLEEVVAA